MNGVNDAVTRLLDEILLSDIYREYDKQRKRVKQYPDLKEQIDEYRISYFELQRSEDHALDKIEAFEREHTALRENPMAADFLASELALCRLIQSINTRIVEAMHFE